eukprot:444222-Rhodomonas_salina.4
MCTSSHHACARVGEVRGSLAPRWDPKSENLEKVLDFRYRRCNYTARTEDRVRNQTWKRRYYHALYQRGPIRL